MDLKRIALAVVLMLSACREPEPTCTDGQTSCSGVCVDSTSDEANCGACGTACGTTESCRSGACVSGCTLSGRFVAAGAIEGCAVCDVARSSTSLSARTNGSTCATGLCNAGACAAGCFIGGAFVADASLNPANACERCEALTSTSSWTGLANGASCGSGQFCRAGACGASCFINGVSSGNGEANPGNPCERCDTASPSTWTAIGDGLGCGNGQVCRSGMCGTGCFIDGAARTTDEVNPANACQRCAPGTSTTAWSPRIDGTSCGTAQVCNSGACTSQCFIANTLVAVNETNPANTCETCAPAQSTTDWSRRADGFACNAGSICSSGVCSSGCFIDAGVVNPNAANSDNACETCVPVTSTTTWTLRAEGEICGAGQVCQSNACVSGCFIDGGVVDAGFVNTANACELCVPTSSTTAFTGRSEIPLLNPEVDLVTQGWTLVTFGSFTVTPGADFVRYATTNNGSTSGQFLMTRRVNDGGVPFRLRVDMRVESVNNHNQLDAAAAILGSFTPSVGNSVDRSQMVYLDSAAVGWADDSQSAPFNNIDGGFHLYELAVDAAKVATFTVDGVQRLTRNNFASNGLIAIGDQTNDPNVNAAARIRSVSLVCQ